MGGFFFAQERSIDTVYIQDRQALSVGLTQRVYRLDYRAIQRTPTNLSEALRFQTPVHIKENGRGMISSPAFRGTTAQQTAILWNGLPVNSLFLGQGDLNNLGLLSYDQLEVQSGGGSVRYGSAAIGGSILLNNTLGFGRGLYGRFFSEYGSFSTFNSALKLGYGNERIALNINASHSQSENDYQVPRRRYTHHNAQYHNTSFSLSAGYRISDRHSLLWHTHQYAGYQHFPIFELQQNRTGYQVANTRTALTWNYFNKSFQHQFTSAFLEENFSYFPDLAKPRGSGGTGRNFILKEDLEYRFTTNLSLNLLAQARREWAEGYGSGIDRPVRWAGSGAFLLKFKQNKIYLEAGLKREWVQGLVTPTLYSFGGNYRATDYLLIKFKGSKNFRYPSFNDLYWQPGGDINLKPEVSLQAEAGAEIHYKGFRLGVTPFYNQIQDMIRWLPTAAGYWAPMNTEQVRIQGIESSLSYHMNQNKHGLKAQLGHAWNRSVNARTGFQLMYTPMQKVFGTIAYTYAASEIYLQTLYTGQSYATSNQSLDDVLSPYTLLNAGINLSLYPGIGIGMRIQNITDQVYETTSYYPLPGRNFAFNLTYNF